jgi:MFS family permease
MSRATLSLVLLVSCAHALVHVYEVGLASVEQEIAAEYFGEDVGSGKVFTGRLSNTWRLMWGLGAVVAGLLVDLFGARRLLALYLCGCGAACALAATSTDESSLFEAMIAMGLMASIYHPAGLSLISHETTAEERPRALGLHGIFGSAGLGLTPLLVGVLLAASMSWRSIYWVLMVPAVVLGIVFLVQAFRHPRIEATTAATSKQSDDQDHVDWPSFFTLTLMASVQGFVYSAFISFLPRYLDSTSGVVRGHYLAAAVLLIGCIGQELAGRFARPAFLERQLAWITFGNVPFLIWMAFATTWDRAVAAGLLALVHFMHQPIYNSLIAKYTPRRLRSLCYGFSFAMGLGLGSFGARFAGAYQSDARVYGTLAATAAFGGLICILLSVLSQRHSTRSW